MDDPGLPLPLHRVIPKQLPYGESTSERAQPEALMDLLTASACHETRSLETALVHSERRATRRAGQQVSVGAFSDAARAPAGLPAAAHLDEDDRAGDRGGDHQQHGDGADIRQENFVAVQRLDHVAERAATLV